MNELTQNTVALQNLLEEINDLSAESANKCYMGTALPDSTFGKDGDIFILISEEVI